MNTPIIDFVENYIKSNTSRLHMPGHKGVSFFGCEPFDITEIKGADELYTPKGIILESEKNASGLFCTGKTVYSAGGSTQSIHAMVYLSFLNADKSKKPFILAGRNAHKAFLYACAKTDIDVEWVYPENKNGLCSCVLNGEMIENALTELDEKPIAVYITSPDYLGGISDTEDIAKVCKKYDIPLLVDNAHGSYLKFCKKDIHPISLGADLCCDSAHKTLPVLTGGGYLHIAANDKYNFSQNAVRAMEIFGSTSPSYLILQSLDLCNRYIDEKIVADIDFCTEKVQKIKKILKEKGFSDLSDEPLKMTVDFRNCDFDFKVYFRENNIEFEYADRDFAVFMFSTQNSDTDFERIQTAILNLPNCNKAKTEFLQIPVAERLISIREAIFGNCETININKAIGRICGAPTVSCPPAVPIAVSGEIITEEHIRLFRHYNIEEITVIK